MLFIHPKDYNIHIYKNASIIRSNNMFFEGLYLYLGYLYLYHLAVYPEWHHRQGGCLAC